VLRTNYTATAVAATLSGTNKAAVGAPITFNITIGGAASGTRGSVWMTLTIPVGAASVQATSAQIKAAAQLTGGQSIGIDITKVGITFPGADLVVTIS